MADTSAPAAPPHLTPREAAVLVGVTPGTIRRWAATGEIAAVRVGGRLRIARHELQKAIRPASAETTP